MPNILYFFTEYFSLFYIVILNNDYICIRYKLNIFSYDIENKRSK